MILFLTEFRKQRQKLPPIVTDLLGYLMRLLRCQVIPPVGFPGGWLKREWSEKRRRVNLYAPYSVYRERPRGIGFREPVDNLLQFFALVRRKAKLSQFPDNLHFAI